eukprot:s7977_g2.t1
MRHYAPEAQEKAFLVAGSRSCSGTEVEWQECRDMPTCNHCVPQNCEFAQWGKWYDAGGQLICDAPACAFVIGQLPRADQPRPACQQEGTCPAEQRVWTTLQRGSGRRRSRELLNRTARHLQEDTKPCFKRECGRKPEEDAMFGSWSEWGLCDSGQRDRHREVATQAAHGGCDHGLASTMSDVVQESKPWHCMSVFLTRCNQV